MALTGRTDADELIYEAREFPLLSGVDDAGFEAFRRMARCHDYPKGNILHYRDDPASAVWLVIRGKVKITLTSSEGREVVVELLHPGSLFGLVPAIDGGAHPAHAVTATDARLAKFDAATFRRWLQQQGGAQHVVMEELASRIRQAYRRIGEHALLGVKDRLLSALFEIAEREGEPGPEGEDMVFTRPTHQELAERIGSSREVVTRVLRELLEDDLVSAKGRVIYVPLSALVLRE